jgi:UDPglucose 6-dehydrogenase
VTAACFATKGYRVLGIDPNVERLELIRRAKPPFFEPGLAAYLQNAVNNGTLTVANLPDGSEQSDVIYITVGTPSTKDGVIDVAHVKNAATVIGRVLRDSKRSQIVLIKSTVLPGTARKTIKPILESESEKSAGRGFSLLSNPEFLKEGNAIHDTEYPDRIVIGGDDTKAIEKLESFYRQFHETNLPPIIRTTYENAELIKYANNAFLATKVSFINTIAAIAERISGADVSVVAQGIGLDPRIGSQFLQAGLGYGGSCLPKDLSALVHLSRELGQDPRLLSATSEVNQYQPLKAVEFAKTKLGSLRGKNIAILGLAFKPGTDDMREAVSVPIIEELLKDGANVTVFDPVAHEEAKKIFQDRINYAIEAKQCIRAADLAILVTEWTEFGELTPDDFLSLMRTPVVFDGRRVYDFQTMRVRGMEFGAIGLGPKLAVA